MQKVRFLEDYESFKKDTYRVIMSETIDYYYIQTDLHSLGVTRFNRSSNGVLFQVIERT